MSEVARMKRVAKKRGLQTLQRMNEDPVPSVAILASRGRNRNKPREMREHGQHPAPPSADLPSSLK
ncbi:hypothetical protein ColLi_01603 [Colletotrichum liriopes]|uniref:Uncharacterized protein n=1 Tax=Colletotrichum liriopes TaxID=708192 RepID=A0AA37GDP9_9PEZI|nr:hypothetical protein ColLi_01603 [Colletotrichum liriopes]